MSDLLDMQVRYYPEILRRMAAGEKLSSVSDEEEKLAATMLVVEALENEKKAAEAPVIAPMVAKASGIGLGTAALLAMAAPTALKGAKKVVQAVRGTPAIPETAEELLKNFRKLLEERERVQSAKRMAVAAGLGGAAAGALAAKALSKDKEEKKSSDDRIEGTKAAEGESVQETKEPEATEQSPAAPGSPSARALLDKVLKNLQ